MSLLKARAKEHEKAGEADDATPACGGLLFEQCVWEEAGQLKTEFGVRLPNGTIQLQKLVDLGSITYIPYPVDMGLIAKDVVLFPARPVEYATHRDLIHHIQAFIHKYLDVVPFYE
jgi:hypothetical protein